MEILVKNVMKTADGIKLFLAIFEKKRLIVVLYGLIKDLYVTFCGCSMSLSKVMTSGIILHSPPKKEP